MKAMRVLEKCQQYPMVYQAIGYKTAWVLLICWPWLGLVFAVLWLSSQVPALSAPQRKAWLGLSLLGITLDLVLTALSILMFPQDVFSKYSFLPIWLIALWPCFVLLWLQVLQPLLGRCWLTLLVFALSGPIAYWAGASLNAQVELAAQAVYVMAPAWLMLGYVFWRLTPKLSHTTQ
jgi:hypothetical protein